MDMTAGLNTRLITQRCSCTRTFLKHMSSSEHVGRCSRSDIGVSSQRIGSLRIPRARLTTAFEISALPVFGHKIHSWRSSDKETLANASMKHITEPSWWSEYTNACYSIFWRNVVAISDRMYMWAWSVERARPNVKLGHINTRWNISSGS